MWRTVSTSSSSFVVVNVTARLEGLAEPGTVCISESIRTAVGKKLPFTYEFTGEHRVKNIAELVKTYRVCLKPGAELPRGSAEVQTVEKFKSGHRPAIVVLPFQNLNDDIDQQYFCDAQIQIVKDCHVAWIAYSHRM